MRKNLKNLFLILLIILLSKYIQIIGLIFSFSKVEYYFFNVKDEKLKLKINDKIKKIQLHIKTSIPKTFHLYNIENKFIDSFFISTGHIEKWLFYGFIVESNEMIIKIKKKENDTASILIRGALLKFNNEEEIYVKAEDLKKFVEFDKEFKMRSKKLIPDLKSFFYNLSSSWDAYWYKSIILSGYSYDKNYYRKQNPQFAPLYPLLCKITSYFLKNTELSMIFVSNFLGLVAFYVIFFITYNLYGEKSAFRILILYSLYPGALFFTVPYSESTAVLISSISFYFLIRKNYNLSFLLIGIGTAARFHLIFFSLSFLLIYIIYERKNINILKIIFYFILTCSGILIYSIYLWLKFKEPLAHYLLWKYAWGNENGVMNFFKNLIFLFLIKEITIIPLQTYLVIFWLFYFSLRLYSKKFSTKDIIFITSLIPFIGILISTLSQGHPNVYLTSLPRFFYIIFPLFWVLERIMNSTQILIFSIIFAIMLFCHALFFNKISVFSYVP
ncbi:MAG: hypothetical protein ABDH37_04515 [Candidatus Hydrothermales bacterium]